MPKSVPYNKSCDASIYLSQSLRSSLRSVPGNPSEAYKYANKVNKSIMHEVSNMCDHTRPNCATKLAHASPSSSGVCGFVCDAPLRYGEADTAVL